MSENAKLRLKCVAFLAFSNIKWRGERENILKKLKVKGKPSKELLIHSKNIDAFFCWACQWAEPHNLVLFKPRHEKELCKICMILGYFFGRWLLPSRAMLIMLGNLLVFWKQRINKKVHAFFLRFPFAELFLTTWESNCVTCVHIHTHRGISMFMFLPNIYSQNHKPERLQYLLSSTSVCSTVLIRYFANLAHYPPCDYQSSTYYLGSPVALSSHQHRR